MKHSLLLLGIIALVGCGDDSSAADSGTADTGTTDSGVADTGSTDTGTIDVGALDSGALDSGASDAGPPPSPATRFQTNVARRDEIFCTCAVEDGVFPNLAACIAVEGNVFTDEHVVCIDDVLETSPADSAIFECQMDGFQALNECLTPVSCTDILADTGVARACNETFSAASAACGNLTPAIADGISACGAV